MLASFANTRHSKYTACSDFLVGIIRVMLQPNGGLKTSVCLKMGRFGDHPL